MSSFQWLEPKLRRNSTNLRSSFLLASIFHILHIFYSQLSIITQENNYKPSHAVTSQVLPLLCLIISEIALQRRIPESRVNKVDSNLRTALSQCFCFAFASFFLSVGALGQRGGGEQRDPVEPANSYWEAEFITAEGQLSSICHFFWLVAFYSPSHFFLALTSMRPKFGSVTTEMVGHCLAIWANAWIP